MSVVLLTAVSCSQTETDFNSVDANAPVSLGVSATMKGSAQSKAITRSVVDGTKITYNPDNYTDANANPGIGVLLTNKTANGWYVATTSGYGGNHIWYIGDEHGDGWKSILKDAKGTSYSDAPVVPYFMTAEVGQVYAYYPYDEDFVATGAVPAALQLKAPLLATSTTAAEITIDATTSNAKKVWGGASWSDNTADNLNLSLSAPNDKDYMYFDGTDGRYVNNGRAAGQPPILPADPGDNTSDVNPGYKIDLAMKHALSMVSFRVYDGGKLSANPVTFTKFVIKNVAGKDNFKVSGKQMALSDGTITNITTDPAAGTLERNVTNYTLMRQIQSGETQSETAFIAATGVNAQTVTKSVSAIVYPQTFTQDEIQVVITLQGADAGVSGDYPAILTVPGTDGGWNAGKNYIYTLSAGRNRLTVMGVSVTDWTDEEVSGEIPL